MIFVTTGTQLSFDRLVESVESWALENKYDGEILAQTGLSDLELQFCEKKEFLNSSEYSQIIENTTLLIGHAGTGTIITAHDFGLPLIIMPRKYEFGEHRNDHQMATVAKFKDTPGVYVAENKKQMHELLDRREILKKCGDYQPSNRKELIDHISKQLT